MDAHNLNAQRQPEDVLARRTIWSDQEPKNSTLPHYRAHDGDAIGVDGEVERDGDFVAHLGVLRRADHSYKSPGAN